MSIALQASTKDLLEILNLQNKRTKDNVSILDRLMEEGFEELDDFEDTTIEQLSEYKIKKSNGKKLLKFIHQNRSINNGNKNTNNNNENISISIQPLQSTTSLSHESDNRAQNWMVTHKMVVKHWIRTTDNTLLFPSALENIVLHYSQVSVQLSLSVADHSGCHYRKIVEHILIPNEDEIYWSALDRQLNHWIIFKSKIDFYLLTNILIINDINNKAVKDFIVFTNNNLNNLKDNKDSSNNKYLLSRECEQRNTFAPVKIDLIPDTNNNYNISHNLIKIYVISNYGANGYCRVGMFYFGCEGTIDSVKSINAE